VPEGQEPPNPLPSWVNDVVTPTDIKRLNRFLAVTGWNTVVGINLGRWDEALAADEKDRMSMVTVHQYSAGPTG
jgi:hypothetical protein